jgi:hypothetical protein
VVLFNRIGKIRNKLKSRVKDFLPVDRIHLKWWHNRANGGR